MLPESVTEVAVRQLSSSREYNLYIQTDIIYMCMCITTHPSDISLMFVSERGREVWIPSFGIDIHLFIQETDAAAAVVWDARLSSLYETVQQERPSASAAGQ